MPPSRNGRLQRLALMGVWQAGGRGQVKARGLGQVPSCPQWHWKCVCPPRRSCSIDRSPAAGSLGSPASQRKDLGRSESLRVVCRPHRIFRPSDLIHGEVLGKGCFGQAIKVRGMQRRDRPWMEVGGQRGCNPSVLPPVPPGIHMEGASRLPGQYSPPPGPP